MSAKNSTLPALDPLRRYPVEQAMAYLGISRKRFYDNIKAGRIKIVKDGRRTFVPASEVIRCSQAPAA